MMFAPVTVDKDTDAEAPILSSPIQFILVSSACSRHSNMHGINVC